MKAPEITPGPWKASLPEIYHARQEADIYSSAHAGCFPAVCQRVREMEANAVAIAALPDLLKVLEECADVPDTAGILGMIRRKSREALTLAGYQFP